MSPVPEPEPPTTPEPVAAAPVGGPGLPLPPVEAVAEPNAALPERPAASPGAVEPATPAPPQESVGAAVQQQPVNVNVSIRVDSPGDDGAVTQTNAVVAVTTAPVVSTPVPDTRYQEQAPQYQPPVETESTREPTPAPTPQEAAPVPATWTWNWNCADGLPPAFDLPTGSLPQSWVWNWSGNCGGIGTATGNADPQSAPQYQPGVTQYQPVNVNVSIRIASPGSNGPVVQANVAVAVTVPLPPVVAPGLPPQAEPAAQDASPAPAPGDAAPAVAE